MRTDATTLNKITALAEQTLAPMGLSLWGVELLPAGKRSVVRVYVDNRGPLGADSGTNLPPSDLPEGIDAEDVMDASSPQGVLLDELAEISRRMSVALDAEDMVPGSYVLEVSSPGMERIFFRLDQIKPYVGREIEVVLHDPCLDPEFSGRKRFSGVLKKLDQDRLTLFVDNREVDMTWAEIKKARLVYKFDEAKNRRKR